MLAFKKKCDYRHQELDIDMTPLPKIFLRPIGSDKSL